MNPEAGICPERDYLEIALRAYVPTGRKPNKWRGTDTGPSEWTLIFDTETTTDAAQCLKFGVYQVRKGAKLWDAGYFVDEENLSNSEIRLIRKNSKKLNYRFLTVAEFIENVFFGIGYELRTTIVGFNLPFDLTRLAIAHGAARGRAMKGGFSLKLSPHQYRPRIQVKHLSPRVSLIRFTTRPGHIAGRGMRNRKIRRPPRPGYFVDAKTLAAALTSRSFDLRGLANFLQTETRKADTDEHGKTVTEQYLSYARQDVQATWECYGALLQRLDEHRLETAEPYRTFSEASLGKAYLAQMGIRPWRLVQPDFPDFLTGIIMSTYFGGRAEVHHRRIISRVCYCDFLSMYPTVCSLMRLWRFVISNGLKYRETKDEAASLLYEIKLEDLRDGKIWPGLTTLVQIRPDADIVPVRANYGVDQQCTIGLNIFSSNEGHWFTLADCIASKLLSGKLPEIIRAITFEPDGIQSDLKSVNIKGNPEYRIEPYTDDFYRRVIDLRSTVKLRIKTATTEADRDQLDSTQLALKILANAMSYGCFVELNVEDLSQPQQRPCHGYAGELFQITVTKSEEPGRYFHPLIASLITGGARLMLAVAERLILDRGLDWAFCDTDSMHIAKPQGMSEADFLNEVEGIRSWFTILNPYAEKAPLLKLEDANFRVEQGAVTGQTEPLYCAAVSAKRYALFNLGPNGEVQIRKASAHGLGQLLSPYKEADAPKIIPGPVLGLDHIGVERWQYDVWHQIVRAILDGHPDQVCLDHHPALNAPAASRYSASTPGLLRWFDRHNEAQPYSDQIRPNNFLLAFQLSPSAASQLIDLQQAEGETSSKPKPIIWPKPVAPYDENPSKASRKCFDRDTGRRIPASALKTYRGALAQYHLRPENKFRGGDYTDRGVTQRRHVTPAAIRHIGKEANRWEEKFYLSDDEGSEIHYGQAPENAKMSNDQLRATIIAIGQRKVSRETGVARRTLSRFLQGGELRRDIIARLSEATRKLLSTAIAT